MELINELSGGEMDELVAFLSCYLPIAYSDEKPKSKVNVKNLDKLIHSGPEGYVNKLCVKACNDLWKKNIYVIDSITFQNDLYLIFDKLDKNNELILKNKCLENSTNFYNNLGKSNYCGIKVINFLNKKEEEVENEFYNLVLDFKLQDVQRGYFNEKTFLMNICNCEKVEGINENGKSEPKIVFDVQKMEKSFQEYLQESGYDKFYIPQEHRIYLNDYYYNSHQNYLKNINS